MIEKDTLEWVQKKNYEHYIDYDSDWKLQNSKIYGY